MKSAYAKQIFDEEAYLYKNNRKYPIVVLQVMLCGDQELLAEIMWKNDFDKLFPNHIKESEE